MAKSRILVVDDDKAILWALEKQLVRRGYHVKGVESGEEALDYFTNNLVDMVLLDIGLPGIDGISVLKEIKRLNQNVAVIMITSATILDTAIQAMKVGAQDYITKPFNMEELLIVVEKCFETLSLRREVDYWQDSAKKQYSLENLIGTSKPMQDVKALIVKIMQTEASTILLQGESGTGKDLVARIIHHGSRRASKPFMSVVCAALPDTLLESELMGHEMGAFTDAKKLKKGLFELADGGTVFLDEIGEMPAHLQVKLLNLIEERSFKRLGGSRDIHVDVRVIAASNKNLHEEVEQGRFRLDLFYRLNIFPINLPPLRERGDDVLQLTENFLEKISVSFKKSRPAISEEIAQTFLKYHWPGNVRELRNLIERMLILSGDEDCLGPEILPDEMKTYQPSRQSGSGKMLQLTRDGIDLQELEQDLVRQALTLTKGNKTRAADLLGLKRDSLRRKMERYGLL